MKKDTLLILAVVGVGGYLLWKQSQKPKGQVIVEDAQPLTEAQYNQYTNPQPVIEYGANAAATLVKKGLTKLFAKKKKKVASPYYVGFPDMG